MERDKTAHRPGAEGNQALLWVLRGERLVPPPIWLMRQAGRYLPEYRQLRSQARSFLDFCYTPDMAVEATLQPIRRFDLDAAIIFSDILVVPDALGRTVAFREGEGPVLDPLSPEDPTPVLDEAALRTRLAPVYEAIGRTRAELPTQKELIGFAGAPWTLACYMIDGRNRQDRFAATRRFMSAAPEAFARLMDVLADAVVSHACNQIDAGAQAIQLFDSWAEILLDVEGDGEGDGEGKALRRWSVLPMRRIADAIHEHRPGVPVIAFPRGVGRHFAHYAEGSAFAGISIDTSVSSSWAAANLQNRVAVQGHLDNQTLLAGGDRLRGETESILRALTGGPFIFNLAHGVLPQTPPEHVAELVAIVRRFSA